MGCETAPALGLSNEGGLNGATECRSESHEGRESCGRRISGGTGLPPVPGRADSAGPAVVVPQPAEALLADHLGDPQGRRLGGWLARQRPVPPRLLGGCLPLTLGPVSSLIPHGRGQGLGDLSNVFRAELL